MAARVKLPADLAPAERATLPYAPGWIDLVVSRIDHLPIPPWLFYPVLLGLSFLVAHVAFWVEGFAPIGSWTAPYTWVVFYPVACLAAIHYLDQEAGRAFDLFEPALGKSQADTECWRYELTVLPAREALIVAGLGLGFLFLALNVGVAERPLPNSVLFYWTLVGFAAIGLVLTAELLYHTVRQLRLVSRIHAAAESVDLFHFGPLYSFSSLTARTGMVFIILLWYDLALNPETLNNPSLVALNAVLIVLSAACFVLPLDGMHRRITVEKRRLEWEVNARLAAIVQELYARADKLDLHDTDGLNKMITSLLATRDMIGKIPVWPWRPETFTAFFTALTLPVIVFLIQQTLRAIIGFK